MIFYSSSLSAFPFAILSSAVNALLFALFLRLTLGQFDGVKSTPFFSSLRQITDGLVAVVEQRLTMLRLWNNPPWLSWVVVIGGLWTIQQMLIAVIKTMD